MSVTLITNPGAFLPVYNYIEWVVSSNNTSRCDFVYICDLYVNGSFAIRIQAEPGDNNYGYLRLERILQDYIGKDFKHDITGFSGNSNSSVSYYFEIREQYNTNYATTCVGSQTLSSVLYTSPTAIAWNGALQYKEYLNFIQTRYVADSFGTKFLTNGSNVRVSLASNFCLSFLQIYAIKPVYSFEIKTYTSSGALIGSHTILNTGSPTANESHVSIGAGPLNINEYSQTLSPPVDWISSSVYYYTVKLLDSLGFSLSELKTFYINTRCTKFKEYRLWWLNRLGGYDSYTFNLFASRKIDSTQNTYTKILGPDYSEGDRGEVTINIDALESYTFNIDRLRKDEASWLEELYTSPEIYVVDSTPIKESIEITGAVHNANGTADFVLSVPAGVTLSPGTEFTYTVDNGTVIGMANSGSGTITGFDVITGYYNTDVISTLNVGALITGFMIASIHNVNIIPMIRTTNSFIDKSVPQAINKNINYSIDLHPCYKINTQSF